MAAKQPASEQGIYTAEMGAPPQDIDMASVKPEKPKKPAPRDPRDMEAKMSRGRRYAKGGSVRGGGCEQRGKTKGRFV